MIRINDLSSNITVEELKKKIYHIINIPVFVQIIIYNLKNLEDDRHLCEYQICNNSCLYLIERIGIKEKQNAIITSTVCEDKYITQIFMKIVNGNKFTIDIQNFGSNMSIYDLKLKLYELFNLPRIYQLKILLVGRLLEEDKNLYNYCIVSNTLLHLVIGLYHKINMNICNNLCKSKIFVVEDK
jgi:hypothetical protein